MPKATRARAADHQKRIVRPFCACGRPAVVNMITAIALSGKARVIPWKVGDTNSRTHVTAAYDRLVLPLCQACQTLEIEGCLENYQPLPKFDPVV